MNLLHLFLFVFFQVHCDAVCWSSWSLWGSFIHVLKHIKILLWKSEECELLLVLVINKIICSMYDHRHFMIGQTVETYTCWQGKLSLRRRHNLTLASNVCEVALRSMFCAPNGLDKLMEVRFEFPFILFDSNGFFNKPVMVRAQILVHRWGPRTRILALFCRQFSQTLILSMTQGKKTFFSAPVKNDYKKMYCSSFCHHASEFSGSLWSRLQ